MKKLFIVLCLSCQTFICLSNEIFIHDDFDLAKAEAKKSSKRILIDFYITWCGPCKKLDKEVFASDEFKAFHRSFIFLKINGETPKGKILVERYKLVGYPYAIITDSDGNELDRIRSYRPQDDYLKELTRIESGEYISVLEQDFKSQSSYDIGYLLCKYFLKEDYEKSLAYYKAIKSYSAEAPTETPFYVLTADIYRYSIANKKIGDLNTYFDEVMAYPDDESHAFLMIELVNYYLNNKNKQEAKKVFDNFYRVTTRYKNDIDILKYKADLEAQ